MVWFLWKKLWNACVPGKGENLCMERMLGCSSNSYKVGQPETIEHVLRDCSMAATIWFSSLGLRVNNSYNWSLRDWISQLAQTSSKHTFEMVLVYGKQGIMSYGKEDQWHEERWWCVPRVGCRLTNSGTCPRNISKESSSKDGLCQARVGLSAILIGRGMSGREDEEYE
ncbi:hypothetical protein ACFX1Q_034540 [Malus domestica]